MNEEFALGLSIDEINHVGWEGEFAYHGTPSGVDNTASTYGGILQYRVENNVKKFDQIQAKEPIDVVLANSGVTSDTSTLGPYVDQDFVVFGHYGSDRLQSTGFYGLLHFSDLTGNYFETFFKEIRILVPDLIDMGLSHETLVYLCNKAQDLGALGAKVTGGGRGGYMVALTPGEELQQTVAAAMELEGYKVIRARFGD